MPRYIAFLRAINVGGRVVKMEVLRSHFESLGCSGVETFIASGNVIFQSKSKAPARLEVKIERRLNEALGYEVATFVRTVSEVAAVAKYQPFTDAAQKSAGAFCVGFIAAPLAAEPVKRLLGLKTKIDDFHVHGREVYWLSRQRQGEAIHSNASLEKLLGTRMTMRGWNTIQNLAAKYPA